MPERIYHLTTEQLEMLLKLAAINGQLSWIPTQDNLQQCLSWADSWDTVTQTKEALAI